MTGKAVLHTRYPLFNILVYNGTTAAHYVLGGLGIMIGYDDWPGYLAGAVYLALAFSEMYLHMPLKVCPNCVYYRLGTARCISGLNLFSRQIAVPGQIGDFGSRAAGALCPNNLYIAALVVPLLAMIPALIVNFSWVLTGVFLAVIALLAFRFFVIFPKIACVHCRAKKICPQAQQMNLP